MLPRLYAGWLLGWSLVKSLFMRLAFPSGSGLALFDRNYGADHLVALSGAERQTLPSFARCIGCGRCDAGQAGAITRSHRHYRGMMAMMLSASRSIPDFDAAVRALALVDDAELQRLERRCPVDVPFRAAAAFVRRKASQMTDKQLPA